METWESINTIRVVRDFDVRPIESEHAVRILDAGRRTGSSKNQQVWTFITVRDRARLSELSKVGKYADHLAGAPLGIALVSPNPATTSMLWDLGRAAQSMVLAAWELGIGSVPATVYDHDLAARLLGLPPDRRCDYLLSFGYPADPRRLTTPNRAGGRLDLDAVVREEHW